MEDTSYEVMHRDISGMSLNARLPKLTVYFSKYTQFRIRLGLLLIRLGCLIMGIGYEFEEHN